MAEDLIPQCVDLPGLKTRRFRLTVGLFGGTFLIALLCVTGSIEFFDTWPVSAGTTALAWSLPIAAAAACLLPLLAPKSPIVGFDCLNDKCRKYIAADDTWICGHCDFLNKPEGIKAIGGAMAKRWLTQKCSKCSRMPSSYLCHHCGEIIFLSPKCDGQHPARAAEKKYPAAKTVDAETDWKAQIEKMIAEKMAFSTITQKVCELRDAELKRIEEDQTIDRLTKGQLLEFEKQWANKKLQDLKMRVVKTK
jgi:hypothetical protein